MMHAFVERLRCGDHLIVRAGPLAKAYGDPYERACVGEIDGKAVTLMAFESPLGTFPMAVFRAAVRALKSDGFKQVHLDRLTANPRRLVFTQGDEEGKITMSVKKEQLHDITQIFKADGTLNVLGGMAGLIHALGQHAAGHMSISKGKASATKAADGSEEVSITFNRK